MEFTIACPSWHRPKVETLDVYPHTRVYVAESEYGAYVEANPDGSDIVSVPDEVQGNLCRIRNYMLDTEFANGIDGVLIIDDDMSYVARYQSVEAEQGIYGYDRHILDEAELYEFVAGGFELCDEWGYKFWGVNCNSDPKVYSQFCPFTTLRYIGVPFQAHLRNPLRYDEALPLKEDYDMTLQHQQEYGGALCFMAYHYACRQSEQTGGCATYRNIAREKRQFELLQRKWGRDVIRQDKSSKKEFDYNPILLSPLRGI